ncbi:hypothetical protein FOCC_FOCC007734 [Frankliniella occidentalis]|nr:hypothetical protein FOCC_FOCC007734 [Frankliniella occidentalis]
MQHPYQQQHAVLNITPDKFVIRVVNTYGVEWVAMISRRTGTRVVSRVVGTDGSQAGGRRVRTFKARVHIYPSTHPFFLRFIPSLTYRYIPPHPTIHPSFHPIIHPTNRLSIYTTIHLSSPASIHVYPSIRPTIYLFTQPSIHPAQHPHESDSSRGARSSALSH